jgi:TRAP-type uncharacterized transport system substrate-binding protein
MNAIGKFLRRALYPVALYPAVAFACLSCGQAVAQLSTTPGSQTADELYTLGIVTGEPGSTEFELANDLAVLFSQNQETGARGERIRLLPVVGHGGVQAVRDLLRLSGIDLAMVSVAMLDYLRETKELGRLDDKFVYLWRMPEMEMHVLARSEIARIEDLNGKQVNFGPSDSDTALVTRRLFAALGIKAIEANLVHAEALEAMRRGTMAAMVMVTGKPAPAFRHLERTTGFKFLPTKWPGIQERVGAVLTEADYPNLIEPGRPVATVSFANVLVARNRPASSARERLLAFFTETVLSRTEDLNRPGRHSKWREFDVREEIPNWKRHAAVTRWLARESDITTGSVKRPSDAGMAGTPPSRDAAREELFQQFLEWREQQRKKEQRK